MSQPSPLSAVVLNFNGWDRTVQCLDSLMQQEGKPDSLCVLDNGSTDESVEILEEWGRGIRQSFSVLDVSDSEARSRLRAERPRVLLLRSSRNLGFAAGVNVAATHIGEINRDGALLVLNNDTVVADGAMQQLRVSLEKHPGVSVILPRILDGNSGTVWYGGRDLRRWWPGSRTTPRAGMAGGEVMEVTFASGAAMVIRREAWETLGGFDERFFFGVEDLDLSYRIQDAGMRAGFVPHIVVKHWPGSTAGYGPWRVRLGYLNLVLLKKKRLHGGWGILGLIAYLLAASMLVVVRGVRKGSIEIMRAGLSGIWTGIVRERSLPEDMGWGT